MEEGGGGAAVQEAGIPYMGFEGSACKINNNKQKERKRELITKDEATQRCGKLREDSSELNLLNLFSALCQ